MEYTLYKLSEGFIITSDEETKYKDYVWNGEHILGVAKVFHPNGKKVIAQQDKIDFSALKLEDQKEIGWFDVEAEAERDWVYKEYGFEVGYNPKRCVDGAIQKPKFINGYKKGFQKAQKLLSDRRFTLEEAELIFGLGAANHANGKPSFEEVIKSLSQQSWKVELEMEDSFRTNEETYIDDSGVKGNYSTHSKKPKLTNGKIKITKIL